MLTTEYLRSGRNDLEGVGEALGGHASRNQFPGRVVEELDQLIEGEVTSTGPIVVCAGPSRISGICHGWLMWLAHVHPPLASVGEVETFLTATLEQPRAPPLGARNVGSTRLPGSPVTLREAAGFLTPASSSGNSEPLTNS